MIEKLFALVPGGKTRDVTMMGTGALALLAGRKRLALSLFAPGAASLEQRWREKHTDVAPGFAARMAASLEHYKKTHLHPTNRTLHVVGIPIIVAGTLGLIAFKPYRTPWAISAGAFTFGWVLNFIGHGLYEKNAPAFADDPLSFITGPVWDLQQALKRNDPVTVRDARPSDAETHTTHVTA